jgi:hypothetical protein
MNGEHIEEMGPKNEGLMSRILRRLSGGEQPSTADKVIAIILIVVFLFIFYVTLDANKYEAQVLVIEGEGRVGVNPTTERLDFGDLSRGSSAVRQVTLENGTAMPMYVMIWEFGGIAELMDINKNYFRLAPKEKAELEFATYVPASAEVGKKYTGRVYLFKIPTFGL